MSIDGVQMNVGGKVRIVRADELEQLHSSGQITDEDYQAALIQFEESEEGDVVQFSDEARDAEHVDEREGNPGATNGADLKAQSAAYQAAQAANRPPQPGSRADLATQAHDAQDAADVAMEEAAINVDSEARTGIEEENAAMTDKDHVRQEIRGDLTKADYKKAKADYKAARKAVKEAKKEYTAAEKAYQKNRTPENKAALEAAEAKLDKAEKEQSDKYATFQRVKARYKAGEKHFLGIGSGTARIAKAAKRNDKNYGNVDAVREADHLYIDKESAEASGDPDAIYLTDDEFAGIALAARDLRKKIDAQERLVAGTTDPELKAKYQERLDVLKRGYEAASHMQEVKEEGGKLSTTDLQNFVASYAAGDDRLNLEDEVAGLANATGLSKVAARRLAKKLGFGREHGIGQRLKNAGLAGLGASLGFLGGGKAVADAVAIAQTVINNRTWVVDTPASPGTPGTPGWTETVVDTNGIPHTVDHPGTPGTPATEEIGHWVDNPQDGNPVTDTDHDSKSTLPGNLLSVLGAALSAFIFTNPKTQNAFNEGEIDSVLDNALLVRGNSTASTRANRGLVQEIIDLDLSMITKDPTAQKAIKAAVIQQAIGGLHTGTANTEEILSALNFLKYAQKHPEILTKAVPEEEVDEDPDVDEDIDIDEDPEVEEGDLYDIEPEETEETEEVPDPTFKVRQGDTVLPMIMAFYGVNAATAMKLLPLWQQATQKKNANSIRVGEELSFPTLTLNGREYNADTSKSPQIVNGTRRVSHDYTPGVRTYHQVVKKGKKYFVVKVSGETRTRVAGPYDDMQDAINRKNQLEQGE
ncbi:hypothetical protein IJ579_07980 [bacterium]|nr:hypothetical protein [bacterium]